MPTPDTTVPSSIVFRRAAAAEWGRLWTLRSTWTALLAAGGLMLLVGAVAGASHDGAEPAPIWQPAQVAMLPVQFAFILVVLLAVTGEYTTGTIRSSLQWVPRRGILLLARALVPVTFITACAVVLSGVTALVAWVFAGSDAAEVVPADIAASLGRTALVVAFGGLLTVGLGLLLRSTAGTLTAIFLLLLVLVITLGNSGVSWLVTLSEYLPGRVVVSLLVVGEAELAMSTMAFVAITWTAGTLLAGALSFLRRDTT